ncbi:unnamed protein product [Soboliphyme baturini]|uniref:Uncharacterized protein n=1 Tax=Soboliphyme baturini TaxID=241478 RepID=A0A183IP77_9BILA|nr:unnamed protein product [Soboliphyme baturini]
MSGSKDRKAGLVGDNNGGRRRVPVVTDERAQLVADKFLSINTSRGATVIAQTAADKMSLGPRVWGRPVRPQFDTEKFKRTKFSTPVIESACFKAAS